MKPKNILITGASGLIGSELTVFLQAAGHRVAHLGRRKSSAMVPSFMWDIEHQRIDSEALKSSSVVVHLAGAGIADKPWTKGRKEEILKSRTQSTRLLFNALKNTAHTVETVVSASAIGYYGFHDDPQPLHEDAQAGHDFLADVVRQWECEADAIATLGIRLVKIRIGVVLSKEGGAMKEMMKPIKFFIGAPLGNGKQYLSWIHINDLSAIFLKAITDGTIRGVYNAVAPFPVTNRTLTQHLAKALNKPLWLPAIPEFVLKLLLGEMASLVLCGCNVSAEKILQTGFSFQYPTVDAALSDLLNKPGLP